VRAYVGVTDNDWYGYLAARPDLREVNFWRPRDAREFKVIGPGDPFVFKTRSPWNQLVGGGVFEAFVTLTISSAWDFFGEGNGVSSHDELVVRLCAITGESPSQIGDREIGCVLLRDVSFFPEDSLLPAPVSFSRNIVQGKSFGYPGEDVVVDSAVELILGGAGFAVREVENLGPTRGTPRLVVPRLGQGGFKAVVQQIYGRRCAVTEHKIVPTLQAAHIVPVSMGGEHRADNGLLLRSDVHTMFDRGYLGIDPEYRLRVSPRLKAEFSNGDELYSREGELISLPRLNRDRPSPEFLAWHMDAVFR
jgi:putative restriction endonuclease